MDIKKIFNPLQRIYFMQEDLAKDKANSRMYYSRVEEVSDSEITVVEPYGQGFYLPRNYQQLYKGRVVLDNCAYLFKTKLIRYIDGFIPLWVMAMPVEIRRDQLRNFVRLPIHVDVTIVLLAEGNEGEPISTITQNISGSGVGVVLKEPLPLRSKVKVVLPLDYDVVEAEGEVVRVVAPEPNYDKQAIGINFTNIKESSRKIIIRYIFRKQVARRKKEAELFE
jgi:c-di-GMP-binding flagellar brake protein YcgR